MLIDSNLLRSNSKKNTEVFAWYCIKFLKKRSRLYNKKRVITIVSQQEKRLGKERSISQIIDAKTATEGDGFIVHRPFPNSEIREFDPFLLLDEMGPINLSPGEAKGASDHPHRGFETVTYVIDGAFEHKDSQGNSGKLFSGDVQWMTAGSGVVHSEMPERDFVQKGGTLHGFQLWVNLPKKYKMIKPRYQDISSKIFQ